MDVMSAIEARRSIRRYERKPVDRELITKMLRAARCAPSTVNLQPLEYVVVDDEAAVALLFPHTRMGALLPKEKRPTAGERPAVYIAVLVNTAIMKSGYEYDVGCAVENILLAGVGFGLGTCFIRNIDRDEIRNLLEVPVEYEIDAMIAVGYPAHTPVAEDTRKGDVRYYLDGSGIHRVPKRAMEQIVHFDRFQSDR
jgi:nitroreductase